ncbi:MAG: beta-propeller fold lactonase family protein [Hahellaceae bacterium]|nr:beta-propeller fold lactonase family protein [Hahellaceae bacterium]
MKHSNGSSYTCIPHLKTLSKGLGLTLFSSALLLGCSGSGDDPGKESSQGGNDIEDTTDPGRNHPVQPTTAVNPSRSSTLALTSDDRRLVVVNRQKNSVSVFKVRTPDGHDLEDLITEISVGRDPRYVAITPDDQFAFVTNAIDGSVSVIDLKQPVPNPSLLVRNPEALPLHLTVSMFMLPTILQAPFQSSQPIRSRSSTQLGWVETLWLLPSATMVTLRIGTSLSMSHAFIPS